MDTLSTTMARRNILRGLLASAVALALSAGPNSAYAASSWSPTLLVNTESFQTIDEGDSTTDIEVRFGGTLNEKLLWNRARGNFQFTDDLSVQGTLSGSALNVDHNATVGGTFTASGAAQFQSTVNAVGSITTKANLSGASLRVSGPAAVHGELTASGSFRADGDITINDDNGAVDSVLTFGTSTQTLKFLNTTSRFQFSKGLSVVGHMSGSSLNVDRNATVGGTLTATGSIRTKGNLSGATLNVDGTLNWHGQSYTGPTAQTAGGFLKTDGAGLLTWETAASVSNGSGNLLSLHPEYPGAIYFSSGSTYIGQLTASGGTSALDNSYVWTSSKPTLQDYWVSVRARLPDNFSTWDPVKPIQFRYKTGVGASTNNHLTVRMKDTAGANVTLSTGALVNTAWTTTNITGPQAGGTWTPKGYFTVYVKVAANNTSGANAAAGFLNLNFETTTP